jgi:uncharacterized protein
MWLWSILLLPAFAYALIVALLFFYQTRMIFPAHAVAPADSTPGYGRPLLLESDGHKLRGIHLSAPRADASAPVLLVFGGNAWNAESAASYVQDLFPAADVIAFHYRGYAPSEGLPGAHALQADSLAIYDWAKKEFPGRKIVAIGFSIGSGVAAHLAGRRAIDGAILVTPFDNLAEVAAGHYRWLPVRLLFRHRMAPAEELAQSDVPVAIVIAGKDGLIPPERGEALARKVPNVVFKRTIEGANHNDIYERSDFKSEMGRALAVVTEVTNAPGLVS